MNCKAIPSELFALRGFYCVETVSNYTHFRALSCTIIQCNFQKLLFKKFSVYAVFPVFKPKKSAVFSNGAMERMMYVRCCEAFHLVFCGVCSGKCSSALTPKNSPQDCFFNGVLRFPSSLRSNKNQAPEWVPDFFIGADDGNRTHTISLEG